MVVKRIFWRNRWGQKAIGRLEKIGKLYNYVLQGKGKVVLMTFF
jgi:hypothetical protein